MTRESGYVVTFWTNVPPHGRVWINKDVYWSISSEEEGMSNRRAVVAEMSKEFGGDLRWVDLETKMGTGASELVRRFIDPNG